jgi:hypothetical protein
MRKNTVIMLNIEQLIKNNNFHSFYSAKIIRVNEWRKLCLMLFYGSRISIFDKDKVKNSWLKKTPVSRLSNQGTNVSHTEREMPISLKVSWYKLILTTQLRRGQASQPLRRKGWVK